MSRHSERMARRKRAEMWETALTIAGLFLFIVPSALVLGIYFYKGF